MALVDEKRLGIGDATRGKGIGGVSGGSFIDLNAGELLRQLRRLSKSVGPQVARKVLRAAGRPILNETRKRAPVLSGELRDSIKLRTSVKKFFAQGKVVATAPHAALVEFGTKPHYMKRRGGILRRRVKHPGAKPKPFLRPAFDSKKDEAVTRARAVLREAVLSTTRGGG